MNSIRWKSTYFLTTPIYYVNANPHIGHLYTTVLADAIARFQRMKTPDLSVKFMTGTDEHGLKISKSAKKHSEDEKTFCDRVSQRYRELFNQYDISQTDFIRTTEDQHKNTVSKLWNKIAENGLIYSAKYSGWYCTADETFIPDSKVEPEENPDGSHSVKESEKTVYFTEEFNYMFKLTNFQKDLQYWIRGQVVKPVGFQKLLEELINNDEVMKDISVSRPVSRVEWGIPVPNDPSQNIYVWLDALSSYLTSAGYPDNLFQWPPDIQVIGKDILKFHGVYWPAFLMAAGLDPPKRILCHSHWLRDGVKMSKSLGNVIDPLEKLKDFTSDGFRYFLLRIGVPHDDGNYCESEAINVINAELANKLGNLLSRCSSKILNPKQVFPGCSQESLNRHCTHSAADLIRSLEGLPESVYIHYENFDFYKGIDEIMATVTLTNKFFHEEKPWELCKDQKNNDHCRAILHIVMESLRVCGILLQPIVPGISGNILNSLHINPENRNFDSIRPFSWEKIGQSGDKSLLLGRQKLFSRIRVAA